MSRIAIVLILILYAFGAAIAQSPLKYSRVEVDLKSADEEQFRKGGFDLEHGLYVPGRVYINDISEIELAQIRDMGFEVSVLIDDMQTYYATRSGQRNEALSCQSYDYDYKAPDNFQLGSMGGYLTYSEMIDALDLMAHEYPNLISVRQQVGTDLTHQGRKVEWVRISDNANEDESEPEILYTALHHAREPVSMMQLVYFMWYLLENYDTDREIEYLVNNTEMYFVPCVNPDGYVYNELIAPEGGGNWRKNMRDNNNDGQFNEKDDGVDLNRNYAFQWGLDDEGSSSNPGSITYRGEEPFSEPEIRAVRDFIAAREFNFALNYHAFGNFLLVPWGFDGTSNPDSLTFTNYGELLASRSGYDVGTTQQTLGYLANGVACDWMYAVHDIVAVTPELGTVDDGFWPVRSDIVGLCNEALFKNISLAHINHSFAIATEINQDFLTEPNGSLEIDVKRYGLNSGSLALSIASLSPELDILGTLEEVNLTKFEEQAFFYEYVLDSRAELGEEYAFVVKLDNGFFETRDTIRKVYGNRELAIDSDGSSLDGWTSVGITEWGVTDEYAKSGETSITDSPYSFYSADAVSQLVLTDPIDLTEVYSARLEFDTRWDIEEIIDYALIEASSDGVNYAPLCGQFSTEGSIFQRPGEPVYDGIQDEWVREVISLEDYVGGEVYLRISMHSDAYFERDGIYVDDLTFITYDTEGETTSVSNISKEEFAYRQFPNPASQNITVQFEVPEDIDYSDGKLRLFDANGRNVAAFEIGSGFFRESIDVSDLPSGIYQSVIVLDGTNLYTDRIIVTH